MHDVLSPEADLGGCDATAFWTRRGMARALTPPGVESPIGQRDDRRRRRRGTAASRAIP